MFHVTGADDFLLHVAVPDTDALRDFVLDRLAGRPEVGHVETRVVYEHAQRPVLDFFGGPTSTISFFGS